jgi:hypothetical protein
MGLMDFFRPRTTGSSAGFDVRLILLGGICIILLLVVYVMARPLLYYDNTTYRQRGLSSAVALIGRVPDDNFDPAGLDTLTKQVNAPIALSVGIFATARVPIKLDTVVATGSKPPTEIWLHGKNWTSNAYLTVAADTPTLQYNWDFVVLAIGSVIVAIVGLWAFYKPSATQAVASQSSTATNPSAFSSQFAEEYLVVDVQRALATSEQLFSRSTLLLVGGVVMAFVGVAVFFLSISISNLSSSGSIRFASILIGKQDEAFPWPQVLNAIRSFAMLFFIEAIAWFLLRQYRSLIEDYKLFYKQYMRRANYLAAVKLATQNGEKEWFNKIVDTYLKEDLTGILNKDQTTENYEAKRLIDPNFVETLVTNLTGLAQSAISKAK